MREQDLNLRPSGYEPDELPGCSIPRQAWEIEMKGGPERLSGGPGGDLLSRALRHSTIGSGGLNDRVRNGIGWGTPDIATRSARQTLFEKTSLQANTQKHSDFVAAHGLN